MRAAASRAASAPTNASADTGERPAAPAGGETDATLNERGRREAQAGAEQPCDEAEGEALDAARARRSAGGAARTQQGELAPVAFGGAERGEVGEPERDEGAGDGEHDVERLRVQRVAGGGGEAVGEVVDELHLAGQRALDPVADAVGVLQRLAGRRAEAGRVDLRLHLPLHAVLRARARPSCRRRRRQRAQRGA